MAMLMFGTQERNHDIALGFPTSNVCGALERAAQRASNQLRERCGDIRRMHAHGLGRGSLKSTGTVVASIPSSSSVVAQPQPVLRVLEQRTRIRAVTKTNRILTKRSSALKATLIENASST